MTKKAKRYYVDLTVLEVDGILVNRGTTFRMKRMRPVRQVIGAAVRDHDDALALFRVCERFVQSASAEHWESQTNPGPTLTQRPTPRRRRA